MNSARSLARLRGALWLLIVAFAVVLRLMPIRGGLPYLRYIDEGHVLHDAIAMLQRGTIDTGFYNYPPLSSYLIAGTLWLYAPVYSQTHSKDFWLELQRGEDSVFYDYIAPTEVIIVARSIIFLASVGIVILAGILGRSLGGTRCGLLSLLFAAICPALVNRGSIVIVDTTATFFALAAFCFSQRLVTKTEDRCWPFVVAASASAALAFVSKYTAGAAFVAVLASILFLRKSWLQKFALIVLGGATLVITSFATMPTLLIRLKPIFVTVRSVTQLYSNLPAGPGYFRASLFSYEMGVPLVIASLLGIALMLWRGGVPRLVAISWFAFGFVLLAALVRSNFQPFRNVLPLVPPLCVGAAFLITRVHLLIRHKLVDWLAPIASVGLALSLILPAWKEARTQRVLVDTRTRAVNWLGQHSDPRDRILVISELAIHPSEWKRVNRQPTAVSWFEACDRLERERFDHIVGSEFDLRFATDQQLWSATRDRWNEKTSAFPKEKRFGKVPCFVYPGVWRTNDQRIVIQRGTTR